MIKLNGTKKVEVPYFANQLLDNKKSVLIIGECQGGIEGISETINEKGFSDVSTTDIMPSLPEYWLRKNTEWKHIQCDFIEFDESKKFDFVISINTIHNLDRNDCATALQEIERVTGGSSFITVDAYRNEDEKARMEAWNLTALTMMSVDEWKDFFMEVGYSGDYYWFIP